MHETIKTIVDSVLETYEVEVKAIIPMDRQILASMLTMELYKELAPSKKPRTVPKKSDSLLNINLGGSAT